MVRKNIANAKEIVIKIGSRVLLEQNGRPNYPHIAHIVEQIASLHKDGRKIVFVSSGAVGSGMEALGLNKRPTDLPVLQAAAAVGQVRLMRAYEDLFAKHGIITAQVLLTHDDLNNRKRHLNIKNTLHELQKRKIIPIINENDTVSVDEIKFGDNDILASLVAMLLEVKALVLLTTQDGFMITNKLGQKEVLPQITELDEQVLRHIEEHKIGLSVGGMKSKLMAASNMIHVGGVAIIAPGARKNCLKEIFSGLDIGTVVGDFFVDKNGKMPGRKRWIAFYNRPKAQVVVDDGAKEALLKNKKSLLNVGVKKIEGQFKEGAVIEILDLEGKAFAKGVAKLSSEDIFKIAGAKVVHRDNLVILQQEK